MSHFWTSPLYTYLKNVFRCNYGERQWKIGCTGIQYRYAASIGKTTILHDLSQIDGPPLPLKMNGPQRTAVSRKEFSREANTPGRLWIMKLKGPTNRCLTASCLHPSGYEVADKTDT